MMTRFQFLPIAALLALGFGSVLPVTAVPQQGHSVSARLTEPAGRFSYQPPAGWHIRTFPGLKYKISYAMPAGGFAPNINVVDETAPMPMAQYAQLSLSHMKQLYSAFHLESQSAFVTASGLQGIRMMSTGTVMAKSVRQVFYLFPAPANRKLVVTASWLASDGNKYTQAVDSSLKTFVVK